MPEGRSEIQPPWVRCRCGKERPVRIDARMGEYVMRRLAEMTACRACEADLSREMDSCPETITLPNGVSGCSLTWHHQGRCQPYPDIDYEAVKAAHIGRNRPPTKGIVAMRARFGTDVVCSQCGKRLRGHQGVTRGYHVNAHKGLGGTPCIGASLTDHLPAVSEKKATA